MCTQISKREGNELTRWPLFTNSKLLYILSSRLLFRKLKIKIYRTIILPVVLYGCEAWSLTLREERS